MIPLDANSKQSLVVGPEHTAKHLGSGSVDVLATPMMIALMEAAAVEAVQRFLPEGWTTVGTKVEVEHMRPTPRGDVVTAEAVLAKIDGRSLDFAVTATDSAGLIGQGQHRRFIVNLEKFLEKALGK